MYGFILKDILANRKYIYISFGIIPIYFVYGFLLNDMSFFLPFLMLFCTMFVLTSFTYDEMAGWNQYALTMPISRNEIIYAKYLLTFVLNLLAGVLAVLLNVILVFLVRQSLPTDFLLHIWLFTAAALVFNCIQLPIIIKLGPEKARFSLIAILFLPVIAFLGLSKLEAFQGLSTSIAQLARYTDLLLILSPLLVILFIGISMQISVAIFRKKEF
jgi:ABC-2 type transport system permease protein